MKNLILSVSTLALLWAASRRIAVAGRAPAGGSTAGRVRAPQPTPRPLPLAPIEPPAKLLSDEATHAQLRDRYIAARFPGIVSSAADLADAGEVVTMARLLFEEGRHDDAHELLQIAIGHSDAPERLRLARLEIVFLQRDAMRFGALAREFGAVHPQSQAWPEIVRLGHALAPGDPFFADGSGERRHEHYGAWPDTPNWIDAPWDLTHDVLAAEFHNAMKDEKGVRK